MEEQLETAHLFWVTLTQSQNFKKLPTPALIPVPGFIVFRQEGKDKFQPADHELYKAHLRLSWEEPSAGKGTRKSSVQAPYHCSKAWWGLHLAK